MNNEKKEILAAFEKMQQAMIDKDIVTMRALTTTDKTFTHMSGKTQSREEYFDEIRNGTLNYYRYQIRNLNITVQGDRGLLSADVTLTAKVYGMRGSWTLHVNTNYINKGGRWLQCN